MEVNKFIEEKINEIKENKAYTELPKLESEMLKIQNTIKMKAEELSIIPDKESGFYKDIKKDIDEKQAEFNEIYAEREEKNREITKMLTKKRDEIVSELESKKKVVDEHRNEVFDKIEFEKLKKEQEKLKKEIELNNVSRDEFDTLSDSKKNKVRKAKENYLNNKHRLDEITPKIEVMELLGGVSPKTKFLQLDAAINSVTKNFSLDKLDKVLEEVNFSDELQNAQDKKEKVENEIKTMSKEEFKKWYENKNIEEKYKKALEEAQEKKEAREEKISNMSKEEFTDNYRKTPKAVKEVAVKETETPKTEVEEVKETPKTLDDSHKEVLNILNPKQSKYEKELSKETRRPIESDLVRNVRDTVDKMVNKKHLSEEDKKIDIKFNAKAGKYVVRDHDDMKNGVSSSIGLDEFNIKSLHNLKGALKTKFELSDEQVEKIDIYTASILAVYDRNKNSQKLSKYIETIKQPVTKENRKNLAKSGITITYNMKELYTTDTLYLREKRMLIDIANTNKKANVATVKKGFKTTAFEYRDKIQRMFDRVKTKNLKSGEEQEIEEGSAKTGKERIVNDLKRNSLRKSVKVENRENSIEEKAKANIDSQEKSMEEEAKKISDEVRNILQK